jgi:hypothetical protein
LPIPVVEPEPRQPSSTCRSPDGSRARRFVFAEEIKNQLGGSFVEQC